MRSPARRNTNDMRMCRTPRPQGAQHPTEVVMSRPDTVTASTSSTSTATTSKKKQPAADASATSDTPASISVLRQLSQLLLHPSHPLQQQRAPTAPTDAPAAADIAPASSMGPAVSSTGTSSTSISEASSSLLQHVHQSEEARLCSGMVNITAALTQHESGAAAGSSGGELRGGDGSSALSVSQEDLLVRQALRLLMAHDGSGDAEAGKVSRQTDRYNTHVHAAYHHKAL